MYTRQVLYHYISAQVIFLWKHFFLYYESNSSFYGHLYLFFYLFISFSNHLIYRMIRFFLLWYKLNEFPLVCYLWSLHILHFTHSNFFYVIEFSFHFWHMGFEWLLESIPFVKNGLGRSQTGDRGRMERRMDSSNTVTYQYAGGVRDGMKETEASGSLEWHSCCFWWSGLILGPKR